MTDRELLEMAAKAFGLKIHRTLQRERDDAGKGGTGLWVMHDGELFHSCWNPLTDDAIALRLAVKLRLNIQHYARSTGAICVQAAIDWALCNDAFHEEHGDSPYAATRRAIVRAAAEIGKAMP